MSKKVTRVTRSDGSHEEIVEIKKGCLYYFGIAFVVLFVVAMTLKYWYIDVPIIIGLFVLGLVGKAVERKQGK